MVTFEQAFDEYRATLLKPLNGNTSYKVLIGQARAKEDVAPGTGEASDLYLEAARRALRYGKEREFIDAIGHAWSGGQSGEYNLEKLVTNGSKTFRKLRAEFEPIKKLQDEIKGLKRIGFYSGDGQNAFLDEDLVVMMALKPDHYKLVDASQLDPTLEIGFVFYVFEKK